MRDLSPGGLPYLDWGGQGPLLHLAHPNGFPPGNLGQRCNTVFGFLEQVGSQLFAVYRLDIAVVRRDAPDSFRPTTGLDQEHFALVGQL
ncbi:MAG: hypothetical protein JSW37_05230 [Anaerolineales bacterium]|nr:MAG: hypothetical protein JSW37_05230 [Anaerolineales bacterium]